MNTINGKTQLFGIIGNPVGHSLSPRIHNAAFRTRKINAIYLPFTVEKADGILKKSIFKLGLQGLSVTIPHKAWAVKAADELDDLSRCCGAANTLVPGKDGILRAYNTDGAGAIKALKQFITNLRGRRVLLIGYGGSATAIAHSLLLTEKLAMLVVTGRNQNKCKKFTSQLNLAHPKRKTKILASDLTDLDPEDIDIIIHTTPLGMQGQDQSLPVPASFVQKFHCVFDIVYNPARTPLIALAARKGATTIPGYLMLLHQAVLQFELFTGQKAPQNLMEKELLAALRQSKL